jgi:BirA family biotin operon repressor/biotin-[acetyl-CoA-carboxylase] ligase
MSHAKQAVLSGTIVTDTIITAERQLSGKGRWGRSWNSPEGNLYLTRVMPENTSIQPLTYSQIGALAALSAIHALGCPEASLKWPNDILWNGKKLAGVLIERFFCKEISWISTGIGINVMQEDFDTLNGTSLSHILKRSLAPSDVLSSLVSWHTHWIHEAIANPNTIQEHWKQALSWMKGKKLNTHRKEKTISGIVVDFLNDGSLTLLLEDGRVEPVNSIEVSL